MKLRSEALRSIERASFDLCVIGGGATGAGCALDAQLRGIRTVLLEACDFASGASGASTKLVHGGVRYLEQAVRSFDLAEFSVVRRALRERIRMLRNAPFLTREIEFVVPCFSRRQLLYFGLGLKLYDRIAGRARLAPSRFLSRDEAALRLPALRAERLAGAVVYADGQFDDARYNIALVETFCAAGGQALNYARVVGFEKDARGRIVSASVAVEEDVAGALSRRELIIRARVFLNATGSGADAIRSVASPGIPARISPSKGVHIVLRADSWPHDRALLIPRTDDGRVLFAIPWQGQLLVGTTDEPIAAGEMPSVIRDDAEYLLDHISRYLRDPVRVDRIASGFAGVRPLLASRSKAAANETRKLARDHEVELDPRNGLISIMGGKWTTYRSMAEDAIDAVQRYLRAHSDAPAGGPCSTRDHPLAGSGGYAPELWKELMRGARMFRISEPVARRLAGRYGARARDVLALAESDAALAAPLAPGVLPLRAEAAFSVRQEMAASIEDVLARRLGIESSDWRLAFAAAPAAVEILAGEVAWPPRRQQEALSAYQEGIRARMADLGVSSAAP